MPRGTTVSRHALDPYVWLDLHLPDGERSHSLGWLYWLPNPLFPFIWCRVAVPRNHPELSVEEL